MMLPQKSPRISFLKRQGILKRAKLRSLVPAEFTAADIAKVGNITPEAARAQVQKMVRWREAVPLSSYRTPRTYRAIA
jgi:hypothetical protein